MAKVSLQYGFAAGTLAKGTQVKANDDALASGINDIIDEQINASANIDGSKFKDATVTAAKLSPVGLLNTQGFINLLNYGNFPLWTDGVDAVPDGWSLYLTPTIARDTKPTGSPAGYSCKITATEQGEEGIQQTIPVRASTVYSFALYEKVTAGDTIKVYLSDNGSTPSTKTVEYTDTTWTRKNDTITTASDATQLTIYIRAKTNTDIVWCGEVVITEGNLLKQFQPKIKAIQYNFGAWETKSLNTVYQAATDGFVVGWSCGSYSQIYGCTDSNSSASTLRCAGAAYGSGTYYDGLMMPVKKGDYWKATTGSQGSYGVYWIPLLSS